jgi:enamine deaminase RidA (YjgF/YER057c/UK114 family)
MSQSKEKWTIIGTEPEASDGPEMELNINPQELENSEDIENVKQTPQDTRRPVITVSKNANRQEETEEDDEDGTQVQENQGQGTPQEQQARQAKVEKSKRAQQRIETLLARDKQKDQLLMQQAQELRALKAQTLQAKKSQATTLRDQFKQTLDDAEKQLEAALNANDAATVAKLTKQIADASMKFNAYQAVSDDYDNAPEPQEDTTQYQPATPEVPDEAKSWIKRNPWFFQDEIKHNAARLISRQISAEGVLDPSDPDYWEELDARMSKKFNEQPQAEQQRQQPKKRASPVGSSRSDEDAGGTYNFANDKQFQVNGNKVSATPTQEDIDMAERLGIKLEDQMKEKFKYAKQGYKGYVDITVG